MIDGTCIFDRLQYLVVYARCRGIKPTLITLGAVKTLEWEKACVDFAQAHSCECTDRSFCGIPVVIDSETPGISVG